MAGSRDIVMTLLSVRCGDILMIYRCFAIFSEIFCYDSGRLVVCKLMPGDGDDVRTNMGYTHVLTKVGHGAKRLTDMFLGGLD